MRLRARTKRWWGRGPTFGSVLKLSAAEGVGGKSAEVWGMGEKVWFEQSRWKQQHSSPPHKQAGFATHFIWIILVSSRYTQQEKICQWGRGDPSLQQKSSLECHFMETADSSASFCFVCVCRKYKKGESLQLFQGKFDFLDGICN